MKHSVSIAVLMAVVLGAGAYAFQQLNYSHVFGNTETTQPAMSIGFGDETAVTVYKDPNCGCCEGYAAALRREGFAVTVESTRDMAAVKEEYNIPYEGESCHTTVVDGYVIEGHVPLEAVEKLLTEQPEIAGIGLPNMPAGTPGMPGIQREPYNIYQLHETGDVSSYLTL